MIKVNQVQEFLMTIILWLYDRVMVKMVAIEEFIDKDLMSMERNQDKN